MKIQNTITPSLKVRTDLSAGYWTCTGVQGSHDRRGYYWDSPTASVCYKPKYAPLFGAPVAPGDEDDE